ncbi:MAG: ATP-dependent DNA helicase RecG [Anaerolineae bacterium]|nr:ATP-dependent DNA helicase RecG [Anaerolineae bacterium]MEB2365191.1 ATP-dependent DNA helicase RecG [Chloroflexota bacterium]OQY85588.1 MAG: hypothetical protein B6D42_03125 [Anaerolineae bacterium UTCFX5]
MPSAIEQLVKILKLERQQGANNRAVVGGLRAYSATWSMQAYEQARRPEQRRLVDELTSLMRGYDDIGERERRLQIVNYMLDRVTGRVQPPTEREVFEAGDAAKQPPPTAQSTPKPVAPTETPAHESRPPKSETPADPREQAAREQPAQPRPPRQDRRDRAEQTRDQGRREERRNKQDRPRGEQQRREGGPNRPDRGQHGKQQHDRHDQQRPRGGDEGDLSFDVSDPIEVLHTGQLDIPTEIRLARPPRSPRPNVDPEAATDIMRGLRASVETVRGIGPKMVESLANLNVHTIEDMLALLPRRYDDYTRLTSISRLVPTQNTTVIATVRRSELKAIKSKRKDLWVEFYDGTGTLHVTFFGQHYLSRTFQPSTQFVLHGRVTAFRGQPQMTNPEWEQIDPENLRQIGIVPIYPLTEGISGRTMRRLMRDTVTYWAERLPDYMPVTVLERTDLADLGWAIKNLHFPEGHDHLAHARNRYVFDELLLMQLSILATRREWQSTPAEPLPVDDGFMDEFIASVFPYSLTTAQQRAIADIRHDAAKPIPMNRLLQGDVGSGKTAVAISAMILAFANGKQAALMAPTGILAEQHYRSISRQLEATPGDRKPHVALLTSALSAADKRAVIAGLADGSIDIVIGTHAVIEEGVTFQNLGLAVIDEQHRFGVQQRGRLRGKGLNPHVLVMTATPIPRTLALTLFADLDLTVLDEMPPGRTPIDTYIIPDVKRERMYRFVEEQLEQGRQAFIVHPLVEASETIEAASAVEEYERLSQVFYRYRVGLLHGKMRPAEKDDIMGAFSHGEIDVLVTTSVAEVGVDVPNANVIIIEGANRFGLAQLHQFRGRVGRGQHKSTCFLVPDADTPESEARLKALTETTDGFKLAEIDWQQRGAGDLIGTRQSGRSKLQLLHAMVPHLVDMAQREARTLFEEDPYLTLPEHRLLAERVAMLYDPEIDVS